jgi:hypothetical protein
MSDDVSSAACTKKHVNWKRYREFAARIVRVENSNVFGESLQELIASANGSVLA